jgi:carbon-monoxide dehydrogenase medium subunit
MVLGGEVVLLGPDGERTVPAGDFFRTYLTTAAEPGELVTEVRLPSAAGRPWAFAEEVRRFSDFATVSVAVQVRPPAVLRVGLGGVADRPVLVADDVLDPLRNPEPDIIAAVADTIADALDPEDDVHATGEYRRRLVRVHVRRALERVLTQAEPPSNPGATR